MSTQTAGMILTMAGAGAYCYLSHKDLPISAVILIGAAFAGFIIGGYADTIINPPVVAVTK